MPMTTGITNPGVCQPEHLTVWTSVSTVPEPDGFLGDARAEQSQLAQGVVECLDAGGLDKAG